MIDRSQCARCGKFVLWSAAEYVEWESFDGDEVCPSCVTGAEEQEIFDDYMEGLPPIGTEDGS